MSKCNSNLDNTKQIKCPECLNYMLIHKHSNGGYSGQCSVCKSIIYSKQHTPRERLIRIIKSK